VTAKAAARRIDLIIGLYLETRQSNLSTRIFEITFMDYTDFTLPAPTVGTPEASFL
jgi:hypothetical protein